MMKIEDKSIAFVFPYRNYSGAEVVIRRLAIRAQKTGWRVACFSLVSVPEYVRMPFDDVEVYDQPNLMNEPQTITEGTITKLREFRFIYHHALDKGVRLLMKGGLPDAIFLDAIHQVVGVPHYYNGGIHGEKMDAVWFCDLTREHIVRDLVKEVDCEVSYIPNPIDLVEYKGFAKSNTVAMVGRISHEKNQIEFINIMREFPQLHGLLVGASTPLQLWYWDQVARAMQGSNVRVTEGYVIDVIPLLCGARMMLHTSMEENQPLAILEAMAVGVPVIARNSGGISKIIEHGRTGFLYNNQEEAVALVRLLLEDVELSTFISTNARKYIEGSLHPIEKTWEQYEALFDRLDKKRREKKGTAKAKKFYNECHLGDCLWVITYFNSILEVNDFDIIFYANSSYFKQLEELVHPAYLDRVSFRPIEEVNRNDSINTWIGYPGNSFHENIKTNDSEIQAMCFQMFSEISRKNGIFFPLKDKSEFIYDHPWLDGSNEMLRSLGSPEVLFVNSTPMSTQFSQDESVLASLYEELRGKRVFTTKKVEGFPCTQDYGLSLLQIGQIAAKSKIVIGIQTGPFCACVNSQAIKNVQDWYVLVWKNKPEIIFHNIGGKFNICEGAETVVEGLRKKRRGGSFDWNKTSSPFLFNR